jgi:hypothetical protein
VPQPSKAIREKLVTAIASPEGPDEIKSILGELLANLREVEKSIAQRIFTVLSLAILYEATVSSKVSQFTMLGFAISDTRYIVEIGPVVLAYLYRSIVLLIAERRVLEEFYDDGFKVTYPTLYAADMERIVRPSQSIKTFLILYSHLSGWLRSILSASAMLTGGVLIFSPPVYVVFSIYRCIILYGWDLIAILVVIASAVLTFQARVVFFALGSALGEEDGGTFPDSPTETVDTTVQP